MQDFILRLGLKFSDEEKQSCVSTAYKMIDLIDFIRKEGIISLEDVAAKEDDVFMQMGISLVLEGLGPDDIEKILLQNIWFGGYTGTDLLNRLLITQSLTAIYISPWNNANPRVVALHMASILGEKYLKEFINATKKTDNLEVLINTYISYDLVPESLKFEERLLKLPRHTLIDAILPLDYRVIAMAFQTCSMPFIEHMREYIPTEYFIKICNEFSRNSGSGDISVQQQNIILQRLDELGIAE